MNELTAPNLAPIRDIALRYGTDGMNAEQQQQAVCAIFELCEIVEHVLAYAAEVERLAREAIERVRSTV